MRSYGPNGRHHGALPALSEPSPQSSSADTRSQALDAAAAALYGQLPAVLSVVFHLAIEMKSLAAAKLLLDVSGLAAYLKSTKRSENDSVEYAGPREMQMLDELEEQVRGLVEGQRKTGK